MDRPRNTGKLGIMTGAGSGIGRATALRLAVELATADGPPGSDVLAAARYQGRRLTAIAEFIASGERAERVAA